jgi:hypothetical protein
MSRPPHALQHARAAVLEGDVEIREHAPLRHQRNHGIHVRVRVNIMQTHPRAERTEPARKIDEARLVRFIAPRRGRVAQVRSIRARVLRDDEQLFHAGLHQALAFSQYLVDRAAGELAAHRGDDAEAALVVAALGDLQVRVVARREPDALRRHEVDEGLVLRRQMLVNRGNDFLVRMRPGDLQHARMPFQDALRLRAQAAGDDDAPVLLQRFTDRIERFIDCGVDESAGVHHHHVGGVVGRRNEVTFRPQVRQDALGIHQRLRAAETHEADLRRLARRGRGAVAASHDGSAEGAVCSAGAAVPSPGAGGRRDSLKRLKAKNNASARSGTTSHGQMAGRRSAVAAVVLAGSDDMAAEAYAAGSPPATSWRLLR